MIEIQLKVCRSIKSIFLIEEMFCLGDDERDRKRKLFSSKTNASKEKGNALLIGTETSEEALTTAQDFKSLLRPKKKNGFKLIKTKTKTTSEQKERRSSKINSLNFSIKSFSSRCQR